VLAAWGAYHELRVHGVAQSPAAASSPASRAGEPDKGQPAFRCDSRKYCSQMTSCAEARYFLAHCPNVKLDGNHNGVPCEAQWCPGS
jgi:excalibur calcium-binding domain-containing protein